MALGLADLSTLNFARWGSGRVSQGGYCIAYNTLLRSPEAAFKRRLMGVLEHPEPPPGYTTEYRLLGFAVLENRRKVRGIKTTTPWWQFMSKTVMHKVHSVLILKK